MIRYPNIIGKTDAQKLEQMRSYLHQLVDELNYQLDKSSNISSAYSASVADKAAVAKSTKNDDAISNFNDIKALIIKSADIVNAYSEEINKKLEGQYVAESDFGTFKEATEAQLTASSQQINVVMTKQENIDTDMEDLERTLRSEIEQTADSIKLEVKGGEPGNTASIKLTVGNKKYEGEIDLTGLVTFTSLATKGQTVINGSNITTGQILADLIKAGQIRSSVFSGTLDGVAIDLDGGRINVREVLSDSDRTALISGGSIISRRKYTDGSALNSGFYGGTLFASASDTSGNILCQATLNANKHGVATLTLTEKASGGSLQLEALNGRALLTGLTAPVADADATNKAYVDASIKTAFSNPNLLDNWYFGDPVNQRGATRYSAEDYCIDRWYFEQWSNTNPLLILNDGYISLSCTDANGDTNTNCIKQTIDNPGRYSGKTVTFSVKFKGVAVDGDPRMIIYSEGASGTKVAHTAITASASGRILSVTTTLQSGLTRLMVIIGNYANNGGDGNFTMQIESAKLELGSVSTLANDAPPKKSEQLLECQRYFIRFASDGGQWLMGASNGTTLYAPLRLPVPLRAFPDTANNGFKYANVNIYPYVSGGKVEITKLELAGASGTQDFMLYANHASNALAAKQPGAIRFTTGGYVELSAEI